jgi:hypothetical protein
VPYTNAAKLDTEPVANSYSGGIRTRSSSSHFQSARACHGYRARLRTFVRMFTLHSSLRLQPSRPSIKRIADPSIDSAP